MVLPTLTVPSLQQYGRYVRAAGQGRNKERIMNEQLPIEYTDCALDCLYCSLPETD